MPEMKQLELNAKNNAESWKTYEETDDFRRVYRKRERNNSLGPQGEIDDGDRSFEDGSENTLDPPKLLSQE